GPTGGRNRAGDARAVLLVAVRDDDGGATRRERHRRRFADARSAACDERASLVEAEHGYPFSPAGSDGQGGEVNRPPSTRIVCPVMNDAFSSSIMTTARPMSCGVPMRRSGVTRAQVPA